MSAAGDKGYTLEALTRDYLHTQGGPHVERLPAGAAADRGDLTGTPGLVWECKNHARLDLAGWVDELRCEMENAGAAIGAVVHKRRGRADPARQYVTTDLETWCRLLRAAGYLAPFDPEEGP